MSSHVKQHVLSIVDTLENPPLLDEMEKYEMGYDEDWEATLSGYDYLTDALEVVYIVNGQKEYLGARLLVAYGGPNIYVDTYKGVVEGYWWGDSYSENFTDNIDLNDACEDMYNCN